MTAEYSTRSNDEEHILSYMDMTIKYFLLLPYLFYLVWSIVPPVCFTLRLQVAAEVSNKEIAHSSTRGIRSHFSELQRKQ